MYKIGIDVGGTNTDTVISTLDGRVVVKNKTYTTKDIKTGIYNGLKNVLKESNIDENDIKYAMLGTTQCTNAIIERTKLKEVITIRIAGYATRGILPAFDWPEDIKEVVDGGHYLINGGFEYDGKLLTPLDLSEVDEILRENKEACNFGISCVNGPLDPTHEKKVRDHILKDRPDANVSISSEVGSFNLLERENATMLNSALVEVIADVIDGFKDALTDNGLSHVKFYLCQNDGTIMNLDQARKYPILTISSGPTNSIRGAAVQEDIEDGIIVDVGGTTTDLGVLSGGLARESQGTTDIGGVSTNFRMPDMISIGIGGGTIVKVDGEKVEVGPQSVGHRLSEKALIFGGDTLTLTDIAVKLGRLELGDKKKLGGISLELARKVDEIVSERVSESIDLLKVSGGRSKVIFVGGGSVILDPENFKDNEIVVPRMYDVANAIGATIAKVSGSHEGLYIMKGKDHKEQIDIAISRSMEDAKKSGAHHHGIEVVDIEQNPLAYHPEEGFLIKVKTIGNINF